MPSKTLTANPPSVQPSSLPCEAGCAASPIPNRVSGTFSSKSKRPSPQPEDSDYILAGIIIRLAGSCPVGAWEEIVRDGIELFPRSILFNAPSRSTLMLSIREITTGGASLVRRHVAQHMAEWEAGELRAEQENLLRSIAWG
jgi:hypothetical protein